MVAFCKLSTEYSYKINWILNQTAVISIQKIYIYLLMMAMQGTIQQELFKDEVSYCRICFNNYRYSCWVLVPLFVGPTILHRNYPDNCEKRCCSGSHKQFKTLFKDHMVRLKIISLYIYKDLGLMSHVTFITRMATYTILDINYLHFYNFNGISHHKRSWRKLLYI